MTKLSLTNHFHDVIETSERSFSGCNVQNFQLSCILECSELFIQSGLSKKQELFLAHNDTAQIDLCMNHSEMTIITLLSNKIFRIFQKMPLKSRFV